jgi:hypothetical protein
MRRKSAALLFGLALALTLPMASTLAAADHVVLRLITVKTENADAYLKEIDKGREILKKLGAAATIRVWRARFAGEHTGSVVISVEYPSLATMAKNEALIEESAEYMAWLKSLDKLRAVVSDSLYTELK